MTLFRILPCIALLLCGSGFAGSPGLVVSLSSVGDRVRAQNLDLMAARLRIREAAGRLTQSGRLSNPELETGLEHNHKWREGKFEVGFLQRFPLTDRLRREKEVSATLLKGSEAEVREVERVIIAAAREKVVSVLAIRERRELVKQQIELSREFAEVLKATAERGERSLLAAGQARLEAASLAVEARRLDAEEAGVVGELKPLLGMRPEQGLMVSGRLPIPVVPGGGADLSKRSDYQLASLEVVAAEQQVALEQAKRLEDVEAGVFVGVERSEDVPEGYETEGIVGLRFKIPLPLWNRNEGGIEEAVARKERKEKEVTALARSIQLEVAAARAEMVEWAELLGELTQSLIPLAEEQIAAAEAALREGQGELQSVFRIRERLLELYGSRLDASREFNLARVRHEAALGKL